MGRRIDTAAGARSALVFSTASDLLAVGTEHQTVRLYDAAGRFVGETGSNEASINAVAFSRDGRTLATGGLDQTVRLWSTSTHRLLATLRGHADPVLSVAFAPGGRALATAAGGGTVRVWRAATDEDVAAQCACEQPGASRR